MGFATNAILFAACGLSVTFGFEREQNCIGSEAHDGRTDWVLNGKGE
jgi:hypothetical protein